MSGKLCKYHRKIPTEAPSNKLTGLQRATLSKKRLQHRSGFLLWILWYFVEYFFYLRPMGDCLGRIYSWDRHINTWRLRVLLSLLSPLWHSLREKCPWLEFFWSVFVRIRTKYGEILRISPYLVRMRQNTEPEKLRIRTLFAE